MKTLHHRNIFHREKYLERRHCTISLQLFTILKFQDSAKMISSKRKVTQNRDKAQQVFNVTMIRVLLNYARIIGFVTFFGNFPNHKYKFSRILNIWSIFVFIMSVIFLLLNAFNGIMYEQLTTTVLIYDISRQFMFTLLQMLSLASMKKMPRLLSSITAIMFYLPSSSFKWTRSIMNEILIIVGVICLFGFSISCIFNAFSVVSTWDSLIQVCDGFSVNITYSHVLFHPTFCYYIMRHLGDSQQLILHSLQKFIRMHNFPENHENPMHRKCDFDVHNEIVSQENTTSKSSLTSLLKTRNMGNTELGATNELHKLLCFSEKLLHAVDTNVRFYATSISYISVTVTCKYWKIFFQF